MHSKSIWFVLVERTKEKYKSAIMMKDATISIKRFHKWRTMLATRFHEKATAETYGKASVEDLATGSLTPMSLVVSFAFSEFFSVEAGLVT